MPDSTKAHPERAEARTNLFVLAVLRTGLAAGPIRIRNLSTRGMLVEGAVLPPAGTHVKIERGSLVTSGIVVWNVDGRAGVELSSDVEVESWLPMRRNAAQSRIDEIVQTVKSGSTHPTSAIDMSNRPSLGTLIRELENVSQTLAEDDQIVSRHAELLQRLDIIGQHLTSLMKTPPIRT